MPMADATPLQGVTVLVTRPARQAAGLMGSITSAGGQAVGFPLLHIEAEPPGSVGELSNLDQINLLIFISANAVEHALPLLPSPLPAKMEIAAIGQSTARLCRERGLQVEHVPAGADSESLLTLPRFTDLHGQRILIVRGHGGREYLAEQLRERGAQVDYAEVYRRVPSDEPLGRQLMVDIIIVTSGEALQNLARLAQRDRQTWPFETPLLVLHPRIAGLAGELGFKLEPVVARQANDDGLMAALVEWAQSSREQTQL